MKSNADAMLANKMAESLLQQNLNSFWQKVKQVKSGKTALPTLIDDTHGNEDISNLFLEKYRDLYNSVPYNQNDMETFQKEIELNIDNKCERGTGYSSHSISVNDVTAALRQLKHGKQDGRLGHCTDHLIFSCDLLALYLSLLFTSMLKHSYVPEGMLISTLIPIPKSKKKSVNSSDNYRAIALSSIVGKVLDLIIMKQNCDIFKTSDYQFGFKQKHSTTLCTFAATEIAQYYLNNDSDIYLLLLDASKAFDRVEYVKLFKILNNKGLCPLVTKLLLCLYTKQLLCIKWGNYISEYCTVRNGVKQGGVLSPLLFSAYIDGLFDRLKLSGFGCYVGNVYMGAIGYADDCMLLSPTINSMNCQLKICENYSQEFNVTFNVEKYQLLHCTKSAEHIDGITYNGTYIKASNVVEHLGNKISRTLSCSENINNACINFSVGVNSVSTLFSNSHCMVRYVLFRQFCMALYGCPLWDFTSVHINKFYTLWRKAVRRIWKIPYNTHCDYLPLICDSQPIEVQLIKRFCKFLHQVMNNGNAVSILCGKLAFAGSSSSVCNNISYIANWLKCERLDLVCSHFNEIEERLAYRCTRTEQIVCSVIKDCIIMKDERSCMFTYNEVQFIINTLCTE